MQQSAKKSLILYLCLPLFLLPEGGIPAGEVEGLIEQVEQRYAHLVDLKMNFEKETRSQIFTQSSVARGSVFLKQPNKFRLESAEEVIVSDGEFLWRYARPLNQVTKQYLKKSEEFSLLSFAKNMQEEYKAELSGTETIAGASCRKMTLFPRQRGTDFEKLILWVDGKSYLIKKMETQDLRGNVTTFWFAKIRLNTKLKDEKFSMQLPERAELVDLTEK
jgi:outer membrane lipoprotein-sorting protein